MSKYLRLHKKVERLVELSGSRDPKRLALDWDVRLYCEPLGSLSGFFAIVEGRRCIFYNQSLSEQETREVIAHELGHCFLHSSEIKDFNQLQHITLLNLTASTETEANFFAAELLLRDSEVLEMLEYYTDRQIAGALGCSLDLVLYKLQSLNERKHLNLRLRHLPQSNYLARS